MRQSRIHVSAHVEELKRVFNNPFLTILVPPAPPQQDVSGLTDGIMLNSQCPARPWLMSELRMCSGSDRTRFLIEQGHR